MRFAFHNIILLLLFCAITLAQQTVQTDSTHLKPDTLHTVVSVNDSTRHDSTAVKDTTSASGVDTVVNYTAKDSVIYSIMTKKMSMFSQGDIKYREMRLTADRIDVNWVTSELNAEGVPDTSRDSTGVEPDSTKKKFKGLPVMKDGGELYHGTELAYNFKTKKGKITVGETSIDQGYYHGDDIKKVDTDVLFVQNGRYTTCDKKDPDYFFASPKMKVMMKDKVVGEPVYFYIADVPVFVLPFAIFPNKGGRRSGIIIPAYGEDNRGRFLRHLGYYWAMNDYMDWTVKSDLYQKGGYTLSSLYQYGLRDQFRGSLSGEYRNVSTGESSDPGKVRSTAYNINITHSQTFDPTTRLDANFTFASDNSYQNTNDLNQALNQSISSNATLSKSLDDLNSISLSISKQQNLRDGTSQEKLPAISFSHGQSYPFRRDNSFEETSTDLSWYENIGLSYNMSGSSDKATHKRTFSKVKLSPTSTVIDTVDVFETDRTQSTSGGASISISPKLGYFTISPSFSYSDQRTFTNNDVPVYNADSTNVTYDNTRSASRAGTISTGVSIGTRLYGIIQPEALGVAAVRHTLTPSLSFSYQKQIIGENLPPKHMYMNFNLGNNFEMKTIPSDTAKEGNKYQLMNIGTGISYDFSADSLRFSQIGVDFRTALGNFLNISGNATYDLYKYVEYSPGQYHRINTFLWSSEKRLARLTRFGFSLSTSLSGQKNTERAAATNADTNTQHNMKTGFIGLYETEEPDFSIPWNLSMGFDYSETKEPPSPSHAVNMRGDLSFNLTENWKFSMNGSYDVTNKQFAAPNITISRDLHCWIMNFSWVPTGNYRHYQFEIRIKAPQLQDIKLTKSGSDYDLR
jgi:lipopolysaccharide assembly outer membrane protein LptD (OstA)